MPTFTDTNGRSWSVKFDGLLLKTLRDEHGINLGDLSGADYARIETDAAALVEALVCLCAEEMKVAGLSPKQLAAALTGESLEAGLKAIWEAAKQFFPLGRLSGLQSNYKSQLELRQAMAMLPPGTSTELMSGALQSLLDQKSATGPVAAQSTPATN